MKAVFLLICMGWFLPGIAQQEYFVLIQSDKNQPFYVRMGEKSYSSSMSGHLILSRLKDSLYILNIGFPRNSFPELEFTVNVKRDKGFELKNMGDRGWVLFDTHTLEMLSPARTEKGMAGGVAYTLVRKTDNFARLMAGVVNDTAVLYNMVMNKPVVPAAKGPDTMATAKTQPVVTGTVKPDAAQPPVQKDIAREIPTDIPKGVPQEKEASEEKEVAKEIAKETPKEVALEPKELPKEAPKEQPKELQKDTSQAMASQDVIKNPPALPVITLVRQTVSDTGYHMMVVDDLKDSIDIFIAAERQETPRRVTEPPVVTVSQNKPAAKDTSVSTGSPVMTDTAVRAMPRDTAGVQKVESKLVLVNSDCRNFAITADVDKLRVKMIQGKDAVQRIEAAKKFLKTKCLTAQQVKALTELFPGDEEKYNFLNAAYPFVSDTGNFKQLVSLFTDPVYIRRFKSMVRMD